MILLAIVDADHTTLHVSVERGLERQSVRVRTSFHHEPKPTRHTHDTRGSGQDRTQVPALVSEAFEHYQRAHAAPNIYKY